MQHLLYHTGDDELLLLLLDAPNRWQIRYGDDISAASTLRHALRKAYEFSLQGDFNGFIVKQPNDEVVVDASQIARLCKYLEFHSTNGFVGPVMPMSAVFSRAL